MILLVVALELLLNLTISPKIAAQQPIKVITVCSLVHVLSPLLVEAIMCRVQSFLSLQSQCVRPLLLQHPCQQQVTWPPIQF
jgi:hypothetical protein